VFFYRHMLPALGLLTGQKQLTRQWLATVADHIAEFSLGGLERTAAARRRQRSSQRRQ
jgi:hypothetical protein